MKSRARRPLFFWGSRQDAANVTITSTILSRSATSIVCRPFSLPPASMRCPPPFIEAENPREMKRLYRHYEDEVELAKEELERRKEQLKMRFMESKKLKADDAAVTEFLRELNVANAFFQERGDPIFKEDVWKNYLSAKDKL